MASLPQLSVVVNGFASVFRKAERGVLHLRIKTNGDSQSTVSTTVATTTTHLTTLFRQHAQKVTDSTTASEAPHPSAGITAFTISAPSTASAPVVDKDRLPTGAVHYICTTTAEVVFRDLELLARLAGEIAAMPGVSIERTEWRLTDATTAEISRQARIKAMEDAVQKADDYAGVVGRKVVAVNVDDNGQTYMHPNPFGRTRQMAQTQQMMQVHSQQQQQMMTLNNLSFTPEGPAGLEPSTVTTSAQVEVKFVSVYGNTL